MWIFFFSQFLLQVISLITVDHLGELALSSTVIVVSLCGVTGFKFLVTLFSYDWQLFVYLLLIVILFLLRFLSFCFFFFATWIQDTDAKLTLEAFNLLISRYKHTRIYVYAYTHPDIHIKVIINSERIGGYTCFRILKVMALIKWW